MLMTSVADPVFVPLSSHARLTDAMEEERLRVLHSLDLLDTPPEPAFEEAVQLASAICGTPIAWVNFLDRNRQWLKAKVGLDVSEVPREESFCDYLVGENEPLIINDAADDPRFHDNPFVTGAPGIRFYAGAPLNTPDGHTLGSLCAVDTVPRSLTPLQVAALKTLGRQVSSQIELRRQLKLLAQLHQEKEAVDQQLRATNARFRAFMDFCPLIGFIKDRQGRFLYYNRQFQERFAVSEKQWIGVPDSQLFPAEFVEGYRQADLATMDSGVPQVIEESSPGPDRTTLHWRTYKFPITNPDGETLLGGMSLEVSREREAALALERSHAELTAANEKLLQLSLTDPLTSLHNRRGFQQRLERELCAQEPGRPLSVIFLDVDHFKSFNDSFGHLIGDDILRAVGKLLEANVRYSDLPARIGGEEFAILLPATPLPEATLLAERIRTKVANFGWRHRQVTISAGVATNAPALASAEALMHAADTALYRAKHLGRNRVEFHHPAL